MQNTHPTDMFIIRHGETEWNFKGIYQGQHDSSLTETGVKQSQMLAGRIANYPFDFIYSSDLGRCKKTAEIVLSPEKFSKIKYRQDLRERNLGIFSGKSRAEVEQNFPEEFASFQKRDPYYRLPGGGESLEDKHVRFVKAFTDIARSHPGQKVLVLTHGGALDSIFRQCLKLELTATRQHDLANLGWNHFQFRNNNWYLITWGDRSHLEKMEETSKALDI